MISAPCIWSVFAPLFTVEMYRITFLILLYDLNGRLRTNTRLIISNQVFFVAITEGLFPIDSIFTIPLDCASVQKPSPSSDRHLLFLWPSI